MDSLVALIWNGNETQKQEAANAVKELAFLGNNAVNFVEAGGIDSLVRLLPSGAIGSRQRQQGH